MATGFVACPYCGHKIMKGAMRCTACGKMLKTAAEQQRSIERYKESQGSSFLAKLFKTLLIIGILVGLGALYKFHGREITAIIRGFLGK